MGCCICSKTKNQKNSKIAQQRKSLLTHVDSFGLRNQHTGAPLAQKDEESPQSQPKFQSPILITRESEKSFLDGSAVQEHNQGDEEFSRSRFREKNDPSQKKISKDYKILNGRKKSILKRPGGSGGVNHQSVAGSREDSVKNKKITNYKNSIGEQPSKEYYSFRDFNQSRGDSRNPDEEFGNQKRSKNGKNSKNRKTSKRVIFNKVEESKYTTIKITREEEQRSNIADSVGAGYGGRRSESGSDQKNAKTDKMTQTGMDFLDQYFRSRLRQEAELINLISERQKSKNAQKPNSGFSLVYMKKGQTEGVREGLKVYEARFKAPRTSRVAPNGFIQSAAGNQFDAIPGNTLHSRGNSSVFRANSTSIKPISATEKAKRLNKTLKNLDQKIASKRPQNYNPGSGGLQRTSYRSKTIQFDSKKLSELEESEMAKRALRGRSSIQERLTTTQGGQKAEKSRRRTKNGAKSKYQFAFEAGSKTRLEDILSRIKSSSSSEGDDSDEKEQEGFKSILENRSSLDKSITQTHCSIYGKGVSMVKSGIGSVSRGNARGFQGRGLLKEAREGGGVPLKQMVMTPNLGGKNPVIKITPAVRGRKRGLPFKRQAKSQARGLLFDQKSSKIEKFPNSPLMRYKGSRVSMTGSGMMNVIQETNPVLNTKTKNQLGLKMIKKPIMRSSSKIAKSPQNHSKTVSKSQPRQLRRLQSESNAQKFKILKYQKVQKTESPDPKLVFKKRTSVHNPHFKSKLGLQKKQASLQKFDEGLGTAIGITIAGADYGGLGINVNDISRISGQNQPDGVAKRPEKVEMKKQILGGLGEKNQNKGKQVNAIHASVASRLKSEYSKSISSQKKAKNPKKEKNSKSEKVKNQRYPARLSILGAATDSQQKHPSSRDRGSKDCISPLLIKNLQNQHMRNKTSREQASVMGLARSMGLDSKRCSTVLSRMPSPSKFLQVENTKMKARIGRLSSRSDVSRHSIDNPTHSPGSLKRELVGLTREVKLFEKMENERLNQILNRRRNLSNVGAGIGVGAGSVLRSPRKGSGDQILVGGLGVNLGVSGAMEQRGRGVRQLGGRYSVFGSQISRGLGQIVDNSSQAKYGVSGSQALLRANLDENGLGIQQRGLQNGLHTSQNRLKSIQNQPVSLKKNMSLIAQKQSKNLMNRTNSIRVDSSMHRSFKFDPDGQKKGQLLKISDKQEMQESRHESSSSNPDSHSSAGKGDKEAQGPENDQNFEVSEQVKKMFRGIKKTCKLERRMTVRVMESSSSSSSMSSSSLDKISEKE